MTNYTSDPIVITGFDPSRPLYSSFVFLPCGPYVGSDRDIIIGYERELWSRCEARLLAPAMRWVLFADGQIRQLDQTRFEEALKKDEQRRRELGLSTRDETPESQPSG